VERLQRLRIPLTRSLKIAEGNFWVGTMTGLDRFRDNAVVTFSKNQGLRNFPRGAFLIDRDGSIWLDASGGLSKWGEWGGSIKSRVKKACGDILADWASAKK
jgi:ligand-binding sensor domain-containing protein